MTTVEIIFCCIGILTTAWVALYLLCHIIAGIYAVIVEAADNTDTLGNILRRYYAKRQELRMEYETDTNYVVPVGDVIDLLDYIFDGKEKEFGGKEEEEC